MNLYFIDKDNKQHLVKEDVNAMTGEASTIAMEDLKTRRPDFKSFYQRYWWDNFHRFWIDFGSHTEFYIVQEPKQALHVVEEDEA